MKTEKVYRRKRRKREPEKSDEKKITIWLKKEKEMIVRKRENRGRERGKSR